jgi:hypothetical protein
MNKTELVKVGRFELEALRAKGEGWVVVKPACDKLTIMSEPQRKRLVRQPWAVTSIMEATGSDGKRYKMFCLRRDCVAMWLASIDVETIKDEQAKQWLIELQQEATSVLDNWWRGLTPPQSIHAPAPLDVTMIADAVQRGIAIALAAHTAALPEIVKRVVSAELDVRNGSLGKHARLVLTTINEQTDRATRNAPRGSAEWNRARSRRDFTLRALLKWHGPWRQCDKSPAEVDYALGLLARDLGPGTSAGTQLTLMGKGG